jgi:isoquinoline 1-oxidoreductase beta subunit
MPNFKRRHFILGGIGAVGALAIGWVALPARQRLTTGKPLPVQQGQVALNGWVKVSADNSITIMIAAAEMGQGAHTGLAALLADEMDADWAQVKLEQAGDDGIYNNQAMILDNLPMFTEEDNGIAKRSTQHVMGRILREIPGFWGTGGSSSIRDQWLPLRQAGASARALLIAAAAQMWKVPAGECRTEASRVLHASGKSTGYGELAATAAQLPLPENVTLKDPAQFKLIGKPVRRIDNAAKLNGTATFGIDVLPEGLLYASIAMCPTLGGKVAHFDATAAQSLPGVRKVIALDPVAGGLASFGTTCGGVAAIADTPYHAMRALDKVMIEWDHGMAATLSSQTIFAALTDALDHNEGKAHFAHGDAPAAMKSAAKTISAEYRVPFLAHATMEPMNCAVQFKDGAATVWVGTQGPGFVRSAVAKALGIGSDKVEVKLTYLGGGFGRRTFTDNVVQAALLARETNGAPVQLIWSREQDMAHDFYRPAFVSRWQAGFDAQGKVVALQATSAGSSMGAPGFADAATEGASDTAYAFANVRVAHQTVESAVPTGIWRSVNHSQNGFFTESFVDECATATGQDPLAFRADLLRNDEHHLRVLHRVAQLSKWGQPLDPMADGAKCARGIAIHRSFGSIVAHVAEVSVTADKQIRVHRVTCVIDCGIAVNPNLIRQQMESAIVFGLSAALHGEITIDKGQVQQSNFHDYAALRMSECPVIEVDIIPSTDAPGGVGEPGVPPIAPAVANAVFALTGQRLRSLPLKLA